MTADLHTSVPCPALLPSMKLTYVRALTSKAISHSAHAHRKHFSPHCACYIPVDLAFDMKNPCLTQRSSQARKLCVIDLRSHGVASGKLLRTHTCVGVCAGHICARLRVVHVCVRTRAPRACADMLWCMCCVRQPSTDVDPLEQVRYCAHLGLCVSSTRAPSHSVCVRITPTSSNLAG